MWNPYPSSNELHNKERNIQLWDTAKDIRMKESNRNKVVLYVESAHVHIVYSLAEYICTEFFHTLLPKRELVNSVG